MGSRCNLIIVGPAEHRRDYELFYAHWRAGSLDSDLFWGPERALAFIRSQRTVDEGGRWLDSVWAEGGVVAALQGEHLTWPSRSPAALVKHVRQIATRPSRDLSGIVTELSGQLASDGQDVTVSPFATRDDPSPEPDPVDIARFEAAAAEWLRAAAVAASETH